jgi:hypothetical protein
MCGEGESLQHAADDLVDRLASMARSVRAADLHGTVESTDPQRGVLAVLSQLGARVSRSEGQRELIYGTPHSP